MKQSELSTFTKHYLECALWSSMDNANEQGGEPLDANYDLDDCSPEMLKRAEDDCQDFQDANAEALSKYYETFSVESAGHDFWLNRNGHGAGFWDGDWPEADNVRLCELSKRFSHIDLYVGDDKQLYFA